MKNLPLIVFALITVLSLYACNKKEEMSAMNISSREAYDTLHIHSPQDTLGWPVDTVYADHKDTVITNPADTIWHNDQENPYDTIRNENPIDSQRYQ